MSIRIYKGAFDGKFFLEDIDQRQFVGILRVRYAEEQDLTSSSGDMDGLSYGDGSADTLDDYIGIVFADGLL